MKRTWFVLAASVVLIFVSTLCNAQPENLIRRPVTTQHFAQAFMRVAADESFADIKVSLSRDGLTWKDANYPAVNSVKFGYTLGVGVCGSWDGRTIVLAYNSILGGIYLHSGTIQGDQVNWSGAPIYLLSTPPTSAPACTMLDNGLIIVAFKMGGIMSASYYYPDTLVDSDGPRFIGTTIPERFNEKCVSNPSIVSIGNQALMAWVNQIPGTETCEVVLAEGEMVHQGPISIFKFVREGVLKLTGGELSAVPTGDPTLATDGLHYFVAVIQEGHGAPLHGWSTVVYKSNGTTLYSGWAESSRLSLSVNNLSQIRLAVSEGGVQVATSLRLAHDVAILDASYSDGTTGRSLGKLPWLNIGDASGKSFGLTRISIDQGLPLRPLNGISRSRMR